MNEGTLLFHGLCQNDWFFQEEESGLSKVGSLQFYEVLWTHNIVVFCCADQLSKSKQEKTSACITSLSREMYFLIFSKFSSTCLKINYLFSEPWKIHVD